MLACNDCSAREVTELSLLRNMQVHAYDVHNRFNDLRARSVLSRLQLAALYAATSTFLPEPSSQQTGGQIAAALLRQCWGNRPLNKDEMTQLQAIPRLGHHMNPALSVLSSELQRSAGRLENCAESSLEDQVVGTAVSRELEEDIESLPRLNSFLLSRKFISLEKFNPRLGLMPEESCRSHLSAHTCVSSSYWTPALPRVERNVILPASGVDSQVVASKEQILHSLVLKGKDPCLETAIAALPPYPLASTGEGVSTGHQSTPLAKAMHEELAESWRAHHETLKSKSLSIAPNARETILEEKV